MTAYYPSQWHLADSCYARFPDENIQERFSEGKTLWDCCSSFCYRLDALLAVQPIL